MKAGKRTRGGRQKGRKENVRVKRKKRKERKKERNKERKERERERKKGGGRGGNLSRPLTKISLSRHPYRMFVERTHPRVCNGGHPIHPLRLLDHAEDQPGKYKEKTREKLRGGGPALFHSFRGSTPPLWDSPFEKTPMFPPTKKRNTYHLFLGTG